MGTEWMGRYRPLVAALIKHSNIVQRASGETSALSPEMHVSPQEWQVLEYILEHADDDACMNRISDRLGIAQSTFSKITKALCAHGLVDRYQAENNRKNIILRPSATAQAVYDRHVADTRVRLFQSFFDALAPLSDDQLDVVVNALEEFNESLRKDAKKEAPPHLLKRI